MPKVEKSKLESIPKINRRLYKLALSICRIKANHTCEVCGMKKGDLYKEKPQRVESHHIFSRRFMSAMRWDLNNLICLCSICHKLGDKSAHQNPIWFGEWLRIHKPEQYKYILDHCEERIDVKNRDILYKIEEGLINILNELKQTKHE